MIKKGVISLQLVLVAIVITMAATGIGLLVHNSIQYQSLVTENNKKSVTDYLVKQADHLITSSVSQITDVSMKLQTRPRFRTALKEKRVWDLRRLLDNEFNQYLFTTGDIDLQRIYAFDKDLNLIAKSKKGMKHKKDNHIMCARVVEIAKIRAGKNRLKMMNKFCDDNGVAHLAVLNSVGSFKAQGYLMYVVSPASLLRSLGDRLGMEAQILNPDGSVAYATNNWEEEAHQDQSSNLNVYHAIKDDNRHPVLFINVLQDLKEFNASLARTQQSSLNTALLIFSISLALSFILLNAVIRAMRSIKQGVKSLSKGEFKTVGKTRIAEFNVLIDAFNGMASDIDSLIKKLNKAKQNSEEANQSKSVFLANMSHEIRTPMNAVLGYTQIMLRDQALPSEYRRPLESVEKAGNHLLALINDILDLSKIEAGAIELHPEDFSLYELIDGMSDMFEFRCKQNGLVWNLENQLTGSGLVHGDQNKLRQVLVNFLSNAVKFTNHGGITLKISEKDGFFDFSVADTGMGISSADMVNVLKPFQQAEAGIKKGGTGLGLAISKRQLEIMGSDLHIRSHLGKGSTFSFSIYLPPAQGTNSISRRSDRNNSHRILQLDNSVEALVVDDVEDNREVMGKLLQSSGVSVRTANNGEEAIHRIEEKIPDIVFMDIRMPVMNGTEAMEYIKENYPNVVCVAVTSSVLYHERAGYLERGFDDLIGKPFRFEKVISCIEKFLDVKFVKEKDIADEESIEEDVQVIGDIKDINLPENLYCKLKDAAEVNAITDLEQIVEELKTLNDETRYLASILEKHIRNYETASIVNLLEEVRCA